VRRQRCTRGLRTLLVWRLSLGLDLHLAHVHIVSDCLEVVNNLKNKNPCRYVMILKEMELTSSLFREVSVSP
jgi:hypothetical protein